MVTAPALSSKLSREADIEAFVNASWAPGYRLALRLTGCPASAEDVVQEALVKVLRADRAQGGLRAPRPYFFRALINTSRNHARASGRRRGHEASARTRRESVWSGQEAERERAEWIQVRLASLTPELREAVALKYLEGLTFAELAAVLECPPGTAASRVRRGLEQLRLEESAQGPEAAALAAGTGVGALLLLGLSQVPSAPVPGRLLAASGLGATRLGAGLALACAACLGVAAALGVWLSPTPGAQAAQAPTRSPGALPTPPTPGSGPASRPGSLADPEEPRRLAGAEGPPGDALPAASPQPSATPEAAEAPRAVGRVLRAEDGQPLVGAQVCLEREGGIKRGRTDAEGRFSLELPEPIEVVSEVRFGAAPPRKVEPSEPLPPAPRYLSVRAPGRDPLRVEWKDQAELRLLEGGQSLSLELRSGGAPLAGARCVLRQDSYQESATSDAEGRVRFSGLDGSYVSISCEAEGHARTYLEAASPASLERRVQLPRMQRVTLRIRDAAGRPRSGHVLIGPRVGYRTLEEGATTFSLAEDELAEVRLRFDPNRDALGVGLAERRETLDLRGKSQHELVVPQAERWSLRGRAGGPRGGAHLVVGLEPEGGAPRSTEYLAYTDGSGRFHFEDLPWRAVRVRVLALRTEEGQLQLASEPQDLSPSPEAQVELGYRVPAPATTRRLRLSARDASGAPLVGADVGAWTETGLEVYGKTDRLGLAEFEVTSEVRSLSVEPRGGDLVPSRLSVPAGRGDLSLEAVAYPLATLELEVRLPGEAPDQVHAWSGPSELFSPVAAKVVEGRARWAIQVEARPDLVLILRATGRAPLRVRVPVLPDAPLALSLPAAPGRVWEGALSDSAGPVAGAVIEVASERRRRWLELARSDAEGAFRVTGLAEGDRVRFRLEERVRELRVEGQLPTRVSLPQ